MLPIDAGMGESGRMTDSAGAAKVGGLIGDKEEPRDLGAMALLAV